MTLPFPDVDPTSSEYRAGFRLGFVAPRRTPCPPGTHAYRAGWVDGNTGVQAPAHRWQP